ncbi:MAG: hypothetical protein ACK2T7_14680 [Anaerolineales bacterium]
MDTIRHSTSRGLESLMRTSADRPLLRAIVVPDDEIIAARINHKPE